jgi:hypothetical protein
VSKKKDKTLENFNELLGALKQNQQSNNVMYFRIEENPFCPSKSLYFNQNNLKQYNDICNDILRKVEEGNLPGYSIADVKKMVSNWLSDLLFKGHLNIDKRAFRDKLKSWRQEMQTQRSYIFLTSGIQIPQQPIQIDSRDYFASTKYIKNKLNLSHSTDLENILSKDNAVLIVTVQGAQNDRTYEVAKKKANRIIGLVNLMYDNKFQIKIYPINEVIVHNDIDKYYGFVDGKGTFGRSRVKDPIQEIQLKDISSTVHNFEFLIDVQKEQTLTKLQEKICIAIDWMSLADLSNIPMSFLQAMIALETILEIKSNSISIVSQISMSIYTLLGTNIEDKKKLNAFMKQSYDVRSNIVHNGRAEVAEDMYFELCKIIFQLIYKIGVDNELTKLKDTEDLWKYVELQLMQ